MSNRGRMKGLQAAERGAFTMTELVARLSELHRLEPSRSFRRQVALALRRGLDYGILVKSRNKYRFDPEKSLLQNQRKRGRKSCRSRAGARMSISKRKKDRPSVPRPTVPPPPNFTPKARNLTSEPFKVIRHQRQK